MEWRYEASAIMNKIIFEGRAARDIAFSGGNHIPEDSNVIVKEVWILNNPIAYHAYYVSDEGVVVGVEMKSYKDAQIIIDSCHPL